MTTSLLRVARALDAGRLPSTLQVDAMWGGRRVALSIQRSSFADSDRDDEMTVLCWLDGCAGRAPNHHYGARRVRLPGRPVPVRAWRGGRHRRVWMDRWTATAAPAGGTISLDYLVPHGHDVKLCTPVGFIDADRLRWRCSGTGETLPVTEADRLGFPRASA